MPTSLNKTLCWHVILLSIFLKKKSFQSWSIFRNFNEFAKKTYNKLKNINKNLKQLWKFPKKRLLPIQNKENEHHQPHSHIEIILCTKFHLKQRVLFFRTKFSKNSISSLKQKTLTKPNIKSRWCGFVGGVGGVGL